MTVGVGVAVTLEVEVLGVAESLGLSVGLTRGVNVGETDADGFSVTPEVGGLAGGDVLVGGDVIVTVTLGVTLPMVGLPVDGELGSSVVYDGVGFTVVTVGVGLAVIIVVVGFTVLTDGVKTTVIVVVRPGVMARLGLCDGEAGLLVVTLGLGVNAGLADALTLAVG